MLLIQFEKANAIRTIGSIIKISTQGVSYVRLLISGMKSSVIAHMHVGRNPPPTSTHRRMPYLNSNKYSIQLLEKCTLNLLRNLIITIRYGATQPQITHSISCTRVGVEISETENDSLRKFLSIFSSLDFGAV